MPPERNHWTEEESLALLTIWEREDIQAQLEGTTKDGKVYRKIANELAGVDIERTKDQVQEKIKRWRRDYKKIQDNNVKSTGRKRLTMDHYERIHAVLGHKPSFNPDPSMMFEGGRRREGAARRQHSKSKRPRFTTSRNDKHVISDDSDSQDESDNVDMIDPRADQDHVLEDDDRLSSDINDYDHHHDHDDVDDELVFDGLVSVVLPDQRKSKKRTSKRAGDATCSTASGRTAATGGCTPEDLVIAPWFPDDRATPPSRSSTPSSRMSEGRMNVRSNSLTLETTTVPVPSSTSTPKPKAPSPLGEAAVHIGRGKGKGKTKKKTQEKQENNASDGLINDTVMTMMNAMIQSQRESDDKFIAMEKERQEQERRDRMAEQITAAEREERRAREARAHELRVLELLTCRNCNQVQNQGYGMQPQQRAQARHTPTAQRPSVFETISSMTSVPTTENTANTSSFPSITSLSPYMFPGN
ncbi:uncharacterized protein LOC135497069 [Lineus longissimus]|uniref:uncharacterized protein LOC135497069 n=1 Tax=Lineus longissimus TaxID=88925 RepID=UPI00315C66F7